MQGDITPKLERPLPVISRHKLPAAPKGAAIGLFGGSFDPAHDGHVHVTRHALRALGLDQVWWLVSPGNPLKPNAPMPLGARLDRARAIMRHPRVQVTGVEQVLSTRYTADTLRALRALYPGRRFVWIMGADNMASLHHWDSWRVIAGQMPMAVIARPGALMRARRSVAARVLARARLPQRDAARLKDRDAPAWCFVQVPLRNISSTQLRAGGRSGHP